MTQRKSDSRPRISMHITKAARSATIIIIVIAIVALIALWIYRPRPTDALPVITCTDGPRHLIDAKNFETQYWAYSVKLEGSLSKKGQLVGTIEPKVLQQLSETMQQSNEFRKWLVNSYNGCAISRTQYTEYGLQFQEMDNVARNIHDLLEKGSYSAQERRSLLDMISTYLELARGLSQNKL